MKAGKINRSAVFLALILVVLCVSVTVLVLELRSDPVLNIIRDNKLLNVLFAIEKDGGLLSANVIACYPENRRGAMFDIPPETGLIIRSLSRTDRIEALYQERGMEAFRREVENLTDVEIPFYVLLSFDDFAMLTDLLSGLNLFIPTPVDEYLPAADSDAPPALAERVLLPSGSVTLDGEKIRSYMLYTSEEDRENAVSIRRQQALLAFLRALNDNSGFVFSDGIFPIFASCMHSNISGDSLRNLFTELSQIDAERLVPQQMRGSVRMVDGKEMLFPFYDGELQKQIIRQTIAGFLSENAEDFERIYTLEILNGTTVQDLARRTSELYQGFGYDVVRVANAPDNDYAETVIIDRIGGSPVVNAIAQIIQCSNIQNGSTVPETETGEGSDGTEYAVDFTIILGSDFNGRYVIGSE